MRRSGLARFAWGVLAYNVAVILWGAFVRATGSGAGCGSHWPTCNGEIVPRAPALETVIELTHRTTSGLALLLVVALVVWAFRARPRGDATRRSAVWSLVFVLLEAGVGAGLVLFEWVAGDKSLARGLVMGAHLVNTLFLLGALTLAAWHAGGGARFGLPTGRPGQLLGLATLGMVLSGASGGVAALGDTLFPARSLAEAMAQDLSATSHLFLRVRTLHPVITLTTAVVLVAAAISARRAAETPSVRRATLALFVLVGAQVAAGALDVLLLAPIALQMVHLALADGVWVALVLVAATYHAATASAERSAAPSSGNFSQSRSPA
jgi:cytochrome c oxidase assembly protein subunit 15